MGRAQEIPVTGSVVAWAIDASGFAREDLAQKLKVEPELIGAWEAGTKHPTKTQFNGLVNALKRPEAVFFLPSPPVITTPPPAFRKAIGSRRSDLNPKEALALRKARRMLELAFNLDPERCKLTRFSLGDSPEVVAQKARVELNVPVAIQKNWETNSWPTCSVAFSEWKKAFAAAGVLVSEQSLGEGSVRGFCVEHPVVPVIVVNSAFSHVVRIYTLAHELGHLLTRTQSHFGEGVDLERLSGDQVERWCDLFAASFLMPPTEFSQDAGLLSQKLGGLGLARKLCKTYSVSLSSCAYRLREVGVFDDNQLYSVIQLTKKYDSKPTGGGGGDPDARPAKRIREFGPVFVRLVFRAVDDHSIGLEDAADFLRANFKELAEIRTLVGC